MSELDVAIITLCVAFVVNATFTFRFQRTTLSICRVLIGKNDPQLQATMTPTWIGVLGWLHTLLIILVSVVLWLRYGWPYGLAALAYGVIGIGLLDHVTPVPSYRTCFTLIECELERLAKADITGEIATLKEQVAAVKAKYDV